MKFLLPFVALALTLPTELVSTYEKGDIRKTTIHLESVSTLVESETSYDGKPVAEKAPSDDEGIRRLDATFLDTVQRVKGKGRPSALLRTYSTAQVATSTKVAGATGAETRKEVLRSVLEGKDVLFKGSPGRLKGVLASQGGPTTANAADGLAAADDRQSHKGTSGDRKLLKGLEAELPWRFLLPKGKVEEGSTWKVDVEAVSQFLLPGGELAFENSSSFKPEERRAYLAETRAITELDGKVTATLSAVDEDTATIRLAIAFTESADDTEVLIDYNKALGMKREKNVGTSELLHSNFEFSYEGTGVLKWDVKGERPVSLELDLKTSYLNETGSLLHFSTNSPKMENRLRSEGTLKLLIEQVRQDS